MNRLLVLLSILLLGACALAPPPPPADLAASRCLDLYTALDQAVAKNGVTPSAPPRIPGFPYLRVDRFLASYSDQSLDADGRAAWLARLAALDRQSRQIELAALPPATRMALHARHAGSATLETRLTDCSRILQTHDLNNPERLALIQERAVVTSEYRLINRVLGLYPLTALPVSYGIKRWHQETRETFALPLTALPIQGKLHRLGPPAENFPSFTALPQDALGIPAPNTTQLNALFHDHAPIWEIDIVGDFDRPGRPIWQGQNKPTVDPAEPVVYRYPSHTRWREQALLQLNYLIWFAERPRTGALDILGGALDGLIWRVTLDRNGAPLLYDSIHPCGCYHLFFPTSTLSLRRQALDLPEPPLVPHPAPLPLAEERIVIRIASATHYIQRIYTDVEQGATYSWRDYPELYAIPITGNGQDSLFDHDGLVSGSERKERWLLWPMGIPSPGGMRERGRHATAFVGQRHFDDARLLDHLFETVEVLQ